jgi:serine/threonine-protein kinase
MTSPENFGSYTLIERLGAGGMAEVFFARSTDPALAGRALVVKRMLPALAQHPDLVTLFLDEARLGALLKHPNIVEVLDVGEIARSWYMALAFVDGPDLGHMLAVAAPERELPATLAAWVIARAAEGLHYAHTVRHPQSGQPLDIVHRDVSPQNILVDRAGVVRIADFGVARSSQQLHRTQTGQVKGKVAYMAPEQLNDRPLDARADVLSLGVTLWEALAHRRLYSGLTDIQTMLLVTSEEPPALSSIGVVVDPALERIVATALRREREQRFASAAAFAAALDAWAAGQRSPPSQAQLADWLRVRFVPRVVVDGVATQWAYRGTTPAGGRVDDADTQVDLLPPSAMSSAPSSPAPGPAPAAPTPGKKLVPVGRPRPLGRPASPAAVPTPEPATRRDLVLYVEDEAENREVAALLLKKHFSLLLAEDDRSACALLREHGTALTAVLMDIQLKGSALDGIALVRLLRGGLDGPDLPDYARDVPRLAVPVFFVTAYSARYGEQELLAVGADKLVTKPVDFTQLTMALTSFSLRRAAALPRNA